MSRRRVYEKATCPYCGHEDEYSFNFESETLYCNNCDKEFAIQLETVITVNSAKIFDKRCVVCRAPLYKEEVIDNKCPNCGGEMFEKNTFRDSEFDIPTRSHWKI